MTIAEQGAIVRALVTAQERHRRNGEGKAWHGKLSGENYWVDPGEIARIVLAEIATWNHGKAS